VPVAGIRALVEHRRKNLTLAPVRRDQADAIGAMHRDRLFNQHMQTRPERGDSRRGMVVVGRRDQDGINQPRIDQLTLGAKAGDSGKSPEPHQVPVRHRRQAQTGHFAIKHVAGMQPPHVAQTKDAEPHGFHC
jgi:hypothetical protein